MTGTVLNSGRILYVEDVKDVREAIAQMLKILGYDVECATNGQEGVEQAERWQPDIILMDIRMPVMDGLEATRAIRNNPMTEKIPVYILSAYTDAKTRTSCREAGADGLRLHLRAFLFAGAPRDRACSSGGGDVQRGHVQVEVAVHPQAGAADAVRAAPLAAGDAAAASVGAAGCVACSRSARRNSARIRASSTMGSAGFAT